MLFLPVEQVVVPGNRHRVEFEPEAAAALAKSIVDLGLMHPIVVTPDEGKWRLVAGERRLRAYKEFAMLDTETYCNNELVPAGCVPALSLGDLDDLDREEAELDENIKRADLTWQERAQATARVMALREKQAAMRVEPAPTIKEISAEVQAPLRGGFDGGSDDAVTRTRRQIIVAKNLDDADVAKAKTLDEAYKVIQKKDETKRNEALALAIGKTYSARDHELYNADALFWAAEDRAAKQLYDVLITDPPYGMGADQFGDSGGRVEETHDYKDDADAFARFLSNLPAFTALCKPAAHAYVFCDIDGFHTLRSAMSAAGWSPLRTPLVMHKVNSGRVPLPGISPRRQYELVLFAHRGGKQSTGVYPDVFQTSVDEALGHGAQKPVEAYLNLLQRSCRPGERVFDPYCGTGPIFPAATHLKLYATGVELSPATFAIAQQRLEKLL